MGVKGSSNLLTGSKHKQRKEMNKINVNGVEFCDFGANNYSNGMRLITCYPMPENMVSDVLAGKYPNVWLNPSARCGEEFYGVYGTAEQYEGFRKRQRDAQVSGQVIAHYGGFDGYLKASNENHDDVVAKTQEIDYYYRFWWE